MALDSSAHTGARLHDYLRVVRRRKWIILQALILIPAAAVALSLRQEPLYEASADVLLSYRDLGASLTGVASSSVFMLPDRIAQTQADTAHTPALAARVVRATGADLTPLQLLGASSVEPKTDSDLLTFHVTDANPDRAALLATSYARQFTFFRNELDTSAIQKALDEVRGRIDELRASGDTDSALYTSLLNNEQKLETLKTLQTSNSYLVRSASGAAQTQPKPFRSGVIGVMLGLILGLALAFLRDVLDTRIRTAEEVSEWLEATMLARIPAPPKPLAGENRLTMLEDPRSTDAEAFRMLRTNLEFANMERGARSIMFTSAVESEGKSTTAANLAVALARAGKRVVLVDFDLRKPYLDRFFRLRGKLGLTQVALGHADLDEALNSVVVGDPSNFSTNGVTGHSATNGHGSISGVLSVLTSGPIPPDAGEFVGTTAVTRVLDGLRERFDLVIVDAPPLLHVGDAMTLSSKVDAVVVVTRLNVLRRPAAKELRRLLDRSPATLLGFVATGTQHETGYYSYGYGQPAEPTAQESRKVESAGRADRHS